MKPTINGGNPKGQGRWLQLIRMGNQRKGYTMQEVQDLHAKYPELACQKDTKQSSKVTAMLAQPCQL